MKDKTIHVIITEYEKIVFEEDVAAVSSYNKIGIFDVLPYHSNFIALIEKKIIITHQSKEKKEIEIDYGVLKNTGNKVEIFLGLEATPE